MIAGSIRGGRPAGKGAEAALDLLPAGLAAAGMAAWTWRTWPDVLVDSGRELYLPWQLVEGRVLYRDIAHFNGPLSPYVHALLFRCFGVSLNTLLVANAIVLVAITLLLYAGLRQIAGRATASLLGAVFMVLFAFGQFLVGDSYTYLFPYSHEMTHGMLLALLGLLAMATYLRTGGWPSAAGCGLCLGLLFLTKAEIFLAGMLAVAAGIASTPAVRHGRGVAVVLAAMLGPPVAAWALLARLMPGGQALAGVLGSWLHAFNPDVLGNRFNRLWMGTLQPAESLWKLAEWSAAYVVFFGLAATIAWKVRVPPRWTWAVAGLVWVTLAVTGVVLCTPLVSERFTPPSAPLMDVHWADALRPLPLVVAGALVATIVRWRQARREDATALSRPAFEVSVVVFAGTLLLRMPLFARLFHYGFVLAMPATMLTLVLLLDWLPKGLNRAGGQGAIFAAAALAAVVVVATRYLDETGSIVGAKRYTVGSGSDRFRADARGGVVQGVLDRLAVLAPPGSTLAALPEGAMLNYLSRRPNPTPYINLMPLEVAMFGEERILRDFQATPPDLIALPARDTSEYGAREFGTDYAQQLGRWIVASYELWPAASATSSSSSGDSWWINVLRRKAGVAGR